MASINQLINSFIKGGVLPFVKLTGRTVSSVTTLMKDGSDKILMATGTTVPTDGGSGYAKGCIFIDTDVGAGSQGVYINVGTTSACNFDVAGTIAAGSVATASLADAAVTFAKMQALATGSIIVGAANVASALVAKTDGQILVGNGTTVTSVPVSGDATLANTGALTIGNNAVTSSKLDDCLVQYAEVAITSAAITGTDAGQLGHANGVVLVADPGSTEVIELLSAVLIYDFAGAGYADGGNVTVNVNGGTALTGVVSAANSFGNAADQIINLRPLTTVGVALTKAKGLNLVAASAFTNGGTATGVARVKVAYRVHTHGLA